MNVWFPSRDTGVDLLVSDCRNHRTLSLQVKFSKDYSATQDPDVRKDQLQIAKGLYRDPKREFTKWLNEWGPVARLNKG